jgi:hypothetical protein
MSARCRSILMVFLLTPLIHAAPAWPGELSASAPGSFARLPPTVLDFQVSWNGAIDAGRIRMEFAPAGVSKAGTYIVRASAASQGAGAVLFPYQTTFWSEIAPTSLRPRFLHAVETDPKEMVTTTVRHSSARVESEDVTTSRKTGKSKQTTRSFAYAPVFDIFSAMLLVRGQKLATGDRLTHVIYPFDRPYLLRVSVQGREVHNGRNSIRLTLGLRKIDRDTLELQPYKKLKQDATLWLSDDADRVPIELRAAAFIGDVRATLAAHRKP